MQQIRILKQLAQLSGQGVGSEAGDFVHIFFDDRDRVQPDLLPERRKEYRARAKRAIHSLKERGLVEVFYSSSVVPTSQYEVQKLFVELTAEGNEMASKFLRSNLGS